MCLAIFKPTGNPISIDNLKRGWEANDDGAGYCYLNENNDIVIERFMSWELFEQSYTKDVEQYGNESPFLIHFRITSKGSTSLDNCHPFKVNDDMAIIHNGTITNIDIDKLDKRSDTRIFAEEYLPSIGEAILDNALLFEITEGFIGYSKVCILHRERGVFILNEEMGHWNDEDGCWYSNKSYEIKKSYTYVPPKDNITYLPKRKESADSYLDVWDYENYYDEDFYKVKCEDCKKLVDEDSLIIVECADGTIMELCPNCYSTFHDDNADYICQDCLQSAFTMEYCCPELDQIVVLCDSCVRKWEVESDLKLISVQ